MTTKSSSPSESMQIGSGAAAEARVGSEVWPVEFVVENCRGSRGFDDCPDSWCASVLWVVLCGIERGDCEGEDKEVLGAADEVLRLKVAAEDDGAVASSLPCELLCELVIVVFAKVKLGVNS
jgi:hypothetical protein